MCRVLIAVQGEQHLRLFEDRDAATQEVLEVNRYQRAYGAGIHAFARILGDHEPTPTTRSSEAASERLITLLPHSAADMQRLVDAGWRQQDGAWSSHLGEWNEGHDLADALDALREALDALREAEAVAPALHQAGTLLRELHGEAACEITLICDEGQHRVTGYFVNDLDGRALPLRPMPTEPSPGDDIFEGSVQASAYSQRLFETLRTLEQVWVSFKSARRRTDTQYHPLNRTEITREDLHFELPAAPQGDPT